MADSNDSGAPWARNGDECDGRLLEAAMGGLAPTSARVRPLWDLEAVALITDADEGEAIELVLAPAAAVELTIRLARTALRVALGLGRGGRA
jgi:hypothetical protein